ncbi:hypothetical protein [Chitinophaga sp. 22620]|uniref:hypothetical protein n=1 Tax=Chitinophaga sp. 22620 TaxID=3453952 RepID=UPI003F85ED4E
MENKRNLENLINATSAIQAAERAIQKSFMVNKQMKAFEQVQQQIILFARVYSRVANSASGIVGLSEEAMSSALIELASFGWYINLSFSMGEMKKMKQLLEEKKIQELNVFMCKVLQEDYKAFKESLVKAYPDRRQPLEAAFEAHEKGQYYLSIPVFFAQTDGICKQHTQFLFFSKEGKERGHEPKVKRWAMVEMCEGFHRTMAAGLLCNGAFQLHESLPNNLSFTRHSVLHGESSDYGTELNSMKAISLLHYVKDILER